MKIYIAGKITGYPEYKERFDAQEKFLRERGHKVLNPTCLPADLTMDDYRHIEMAMIDICDAIFLMDNWKDSEGAKYEEWYARLYGKKVFTEDDSRLWGTVNAENDKYTDENTKPPQNAK